MNIELRRPIALALMSAAFFTAPILAQQPESPAQNPPAETRGTPPSSTSDATTPSTQSAQTPIDDQKIEQFAEAYVAVQTIQQNASNELNQAAQDPAKQQQTQAKVEGEMIAAVERTGLKLEEFNNIVQSMTADADLRSRVVAKIRERTGG